LPFILLGVPFTPTILETFKRKDKGPKEIPEQTTYEEKPDVDTPLLERAREEARVKVSGEVIRITGDASIPDGTEVKNHIVVQGNLKVGKKCHVFGSVNAFGDIEIGESSIIEGHVLSEGTIIIGRDCVVKGVVDSLKDIILEENAVVEAVSTEKTVKVGSNAKINRRILSGSSIVASLQEAQTKVVEKPEKTKIGLQPQVVVEQPLAPIQPSVTKVVPLPEEVRPELPFEVLNPDVGHFYFYAPTKYGKTYMVANYVIPQIQGKKRIVVIDPHEEYLFDSYEVNYDKTIPQVDSDLFKTFLTFNVWADVDRIVKDMLEAVVQGTGDLSIRLNIVDDNVEKLIVSEFLKRITQNTWEKPILLIVEEADKYEVVSTVTRGRHANLQVILTSTRKLMPEIFSNAHLVLGNINPALIEDYDHHAAKEVSELGKFEFIWEKDYHDWRKFRLGKQQSEETQAPEEKKPLVPQVVEPVLGVLAPEKPVETMGITERIFSHLEDRIRKFDEGKSGVAEESNLGNLSPLEAKVFKVASKCSSLEEMCLRLLMDSTEVESVLDELVKKGFLDKNFKPIKSFTKEHVEPSFAKQVAGPENLQAAPKNAPSEDERFGQEQPSEDELIEKLIESKMRDELKSKIQVKEGETIGWDQPIDILNEWEKLSSSLWGAKEKTEPSRSGLKKSVSRKKRRTVESENSEDLSKE
jgi:predicted acyltransferase (DUF342 family)